MRHGLRAGGAQLALTDADETVAGLADAVLAGLVGLGVGACAGGEVSAWARAQRRAQGGEEEEGAMLHWLGAQSPSVEQLRAVLKAVTRGLEFLHSKNIVHCGASRGK